MFLKKYVVKMADMNKIRKGEVSIFDLVLKLDQRNFNKLIDAGYSPRIIENETNYKYPPQWVGGFPLYMYLVFQDICKGNFFNSLRYPCFLLLKEKIYKQPLTEKEKEYLSKNSQDLISESPGLVTAEDKIVIAFVTGSPKVGKTTTTENLIEALSSTYTVRKHTIAEYIREVLENLSDNFGYDSTRFFENYSEKDVIKTFGNEPVPFKTRDLLCEFSILMQKFYGKDLWGILAQEHIKQYDEEIIVIDDLRRFDEYEVLRKTFGDRLVTVYIDKEDIDTDASIATLSDSAKQFESKINKEDTDLNFTFNSDWSNQPELFKLIRDKLKTLS